MGIKQVEIIKVPYGMMSVLAKSHGTSVQTVYDALNFRSESEKAALIRKDAIENFCGQMMTINKITK